VTATGGYLTAAGPLLLTEAGAGLAVSTTISASARVAPQQFSLASGIGSTLQHIGSVAGVPTAAAVFTQSGNYLTPAASSTDCSPRCPP